jgi:hypothetical protein
MNIQPREPSSNSQVAEPPITFEGPRQSQCHKSATYRTGSHTNMPVKYRHLFWQEITCDTFHKVRLTKKFGLQSKWGYSGWKSVNFVIRAQEGPWKPSENRWLLITITGFVNKFYAGLFNSYLSPFFLHHAHTRIKQLAHISGRASILMCIGDIIVHYIQWGYCE